jgi:hypothetical protein
LYGEGQTVTRGGGVEILSCPEDRINEQPLSLRLLEVWGSREWRMGSVLWKCSL